MWMTSCTGSTHGGFWGFWKSQFSWELDSEREGSTFGDRWGQMNLHATGAARQEWGRWKSKNRKNVYLSPYVEEALNSKVIKSFVPELRSRKCFSCFGIPMFYVYMLWTFNVHFSYSCMGTLHMYREKEGGWGIANIQNSVDSSIQWLEDDIKKRGRRLITSTRNNTANTSNKKTSWPENKNVKKNNCRDHSSDKKVKSPKRKFGHG